MKKSAYEGMRVSYWLRMQQASLDAYPRAVARAAEDVAAVEAAGHTWDPEDEEWPELATGCPGGTIYDAVLVARDAILLSKETAQRIARVWKVRRPGGGMERALPEIASDMAGRGDRHSASRITAALRLGIEE